MWIMAHVVIEAFFNAMFHLLMFSSLITSFNSHQLSSSVDRQRRFSLECVISRVKVFHLPANILKLKNMNMVDSTVSNILHVQCTGHINYTEWVKSWNLTCGSDFILRPSCTGTIHTDKNCNGCSYGGKSLINLTISLRAFPQRHKRLSQSSFKSSSKKKREQIQSTGPDRESFLQMVVHVTYLYRWLTAYNWVMSLFLASSSQTLLTTHKGGRNVTGNDSQVFRFTNYFQFFL